MEKAVVRYTSEPIPIEYLDRVIDMQFDSRSGIYMEHLEPVPVTPEYARACARMYELAGRQPARNAIDLRC